MSSNWNASPTNAEIGGGSIWNDNAGNAQSSKTRGCNPRVLKWVLLAAGIALLTAGGILLPVGLLKQKEANDLDPGLDFTQISPDCNITEAVFVSSETRYCDRKQGSSNVRYECGCDDIYFYIISAPQLADINDFYIGRGDDYKFDSMQQTIDRGNDSCSYGTLSPPQWDAGEETACWMPSYPGEEIAKLYRCGNDECIKVFDPQNDADKANGIAMAFWISGAVIAGISITLFAGACMVKTKM